VTKPDETVCRALESIWSDTLRWYALIDQWFCFYESACLSGFSRPRPRLAKQWYAIDAPDGSSAPAAQIAPY
jgi:hypothetical protein